MNKFIVLMIAAVFSMGSVAFAATTNDTVVVSKAKAKKDKPRHDKKKAKKMKAATHEAATPAADVPAEAPAGEAPHAEFFFAGFKRLKARPFNGGGPFYFSGSGARLGG